MTRPDPAPAPGCYVVHPGQPAPDNQQRARLAAWLTANHIDPERVPLDQPILVLTVPSIRGVTTPRNEDWRFQVIVLTEFYVNPDGQREANLVTGRPVTLQRTVPLTQPFPTTEAPDGEAHREAAQQAPEVLVRDQGGKEVPDRHEGQGSQCTGESVGPRIGGAEKAGTGRRDQAVPEPQEDAHEGPRPTQEVEDR